MGSGRALVLAALVVGSTGCFGLFDDDEPAPDPRSDLPASIRLETEGTTTRILVDHPTGSGALRFTILRGLAVHDEGNLTRHPSEAGLYGGLATRALGNGTYTIRVAEGGLLVGERTMRILPRAWVPPSDGLYAWTAEKRVGEEATVRLAGTLSSAGGAWRVDASGWVRDGDANGSIDGIVARLRVAGRGFDHADLRFQGTIDLLQPDGGRFGTWRVERHLLREGREPDSTGLLHDALLLHVWTRTEGELRNPNGTVPVDASTVTLQWVDRATLEGVRWERWTWDNVTDRATNRTGYGSAEETPDLVPAFLGRVPTPLVAGDAFVLEAAGGERLVFRVQADGDGLRAKATASRGFTGNATLVLDASGALVRYEERLRDGDGVLRLLRVERAE